jgi:hypothetical protein
VALILFWKPPSFPSGFLSPVGSSESSWQYIKSLCKVNPFLADGDGNIRR